MQLAFRRLVCMVWGLCGCILTSTDTELIKLKLANLGSNFEL